MDGIPLRHPSITAPMVPEYITFMELFAPLFMPASTRSGRRSLHTV